jgi:hypothetical protein
VRSWKNNNSDEKRNTGISDSEYYFQMRCLCKWYHHQTKKGGFNCSRMNDVSSTFPLKNGKIARICLGWVCSMTSKKVLQTHKKVTGDFGHYGQGLERIEW